MEQWILIVEDDKELCDMVKLTLEHEGYKVDVVHDGKTGFEHITSCTYSLVILDIMLPALDGWEVCHKIRGSQYNSTIPIIMLTAKAEEDDKIMGLKLGADDYVTKPFSPRELVARVKALLRRDQDFKSEAEILEQGDLYVNAQSYKVFVGHQEVELPPKEFELLYLFTKNPGRVFTREEILEKIWGFSFVGGTRTVDEHVKRIRKKIEALSDYEFIQTVWGVGYKFEVKKHV